MRRIIVASLFLSSVLLTAQTTQNGQGVTLESRNETPNALAATTAAQPATDPSGTPNSVRVSTGVVSPKLISKPDITVYTSEFPSPDLAIQSVVLRFLLDESGTPQDVQIVKPVNKDVDERVLTAVRQYKFTPATLDDQPVPINMDLVVNFAQR